MGKRNIVIMCVILISVFFLSSCSQKSEKEDVVKYPFVDGDFFEYKSERTADRNTGFDVIERHTISVPENGNLVVKTEVILKGSGVEQVTPVKTKTYDKFGRLISAYDDANKRKIPVGKTKGNLLRFYIPENKRKNGATIRMDGLINRDGVVEKSQWNGRDVWIVKAGNVSYIYDANNGILICEDIVAMKKILIKSSIQ